MTILTFILTLAVFFLYLIELKRSDKVNSYEFYKLKQEVDKLRIEKLKFKVGDYVEVGGTKCFIERINIDNYNTIGMCYEYHAPYLIKGPQISVYKEEISLKLLKCDNKGKK